LIFPSFFQDHKMSLDENNQQTSFDQGFNSIDQAAFAGVMESCAAKTALSSVAGFAMGGLFGMFMSSVDYNPQSAYEGMNMRQQMAFTVRDMYTNCA
jgi:hypothetical protein